MSTVQTVHEATRRLVVRVVLGLPALGNQPPAAWVQALVMQCRCDDSRAVMAALGTVTLVRVATATRQTLGLVIGTVV